MTSFALPLSLGYYGYAELVDIVFTEEISDNVIVEKLNKFMPKGIEVISAKTLQTGEKSAAVVSAASYTVYLSSDFLKKEIEAFIEQENIVIIKKSKKKTAEIDIKPHIFEFKPQYENETVRSIYMLLSAGPENSIRADSVVQALFDFSEKNYNPYLTIYAREALYRQKGAGFVEL